MDNTTLLQGCARFSIQWGGKDPKVVDCESEFVCSCPDILWAVRIMRLLNIWHQTRTEGTETSWAKVAVEVGFEAATAPL